MLRKLILAASIGSGLIACWCATVSFGGGSDMETSIQLPKPKTKGRMSLEEAIARRRSVRGFSRKPLTLAQLSQLLWSAQGITDAEGGKRAAPSAGATYPLTVFIAAGEGSVTGLGRGVFQYHPEKHALTQKSREDIRPAVSAAALGQSCLAEAPVVMFLAADHGRTEGRYRDRAARYVHMEAGHAGQNVYLQAEALGLATVAVGAFEDQAAARAFGLPAGLDALYLMPLGYAR